MTIKDIARKAGVSVSTVSKILNDKTNTFAREDTRERIWAIVQEYGYTPNVNAQQLKRPAHGKSPIPVVCFLSLSRRREENPYVAQITRAIEQAAVLDGFVIPNYFTHFNLDNPAIIRRVQSLEPDCAISVGMFFDEKTHSYLTRHYKHVVHVGLAPIETSADIVICDGYRAAMAAMDHLLDYGHKKIAYIGELRSEIRFSAYKDSLQKAGLPLRREFVLPCHYDGDTVHDALHALLIREDRPTALFCANDITAISVMSLLGEFGLKVPRDISVIATEDIAISSSLTPSLTTVHIPKEEMGRLAVHTLKSRVERQHKLPLQIFLPSKLIVRESTRRL